MRLTQADHADERASFIRSHHVIDVIRQFPVNKIDAETFVAGLRPLQPRLYSIASSLAVSPDEAHLTVATVRYDLHGEPRLGVASGHLATRGELDGLLPVYIQKNPHFRLPADDVPIIMIGAGTGIAPYRAFMQEREARGASGRSWLFFGERNFRTDFLYQTEWQSLIKDGVLTRMDVAFSRDRNRRRGKIYVQHRLKERSRDLFAWLEEGAHLYVCGDAAGWLPMSTWRWPRSWRRKAAWVPRAAEDYLQRLQETAVISAMFTERVTECRHDRDPLPSDRSRDLSQPLDRLGPDETPEGIERLSSRHDRAGAARPAHGRRRRATTPSS